MSALAASPAPLAGGSAAGGNRSGRIGIICGLRREIACLGKLRASHFLAFAAGGSADRAYETGLRWAAESAVGALVSFGMAGALGPKLRPGDLVLSARVFASGDRRFDGDAAWLERLRCRLPRAHVGSVVGSGVALGDPATKRALHARNGALAVDMESHGVAAAAARCEIPFVVLRAIADPADCRVPAAAMAGLGASGELRPLAVVANLLKRPADLPALVTLARHSRAALAALRSAVEDSALAA